ncbi:MAG TPA: YlbF family regulator [Spirochaetota bacterium]|nr:YlbF family regulator [Spirochaetota bacterium]HRZ28412.1 YlbF family regulator [Spirochaetota bacterium]
MPASPDQIILKARELSRLIKEHDLTKKYEQALTEITKDRDAQELLSELIIMGQELNARAARGEAMKPDSPSEREFLRERFEKKPAVKNFIQAEKDYLNLLKAVIEKIKNPAS